MKPHPYLCPFFFHNCCACWCTSISFSLSSSFFCPVILWMCQQHQSRWKTGVTHRGRENGVRRKFSSIITLRLPLPKYSPWRKGSFQSLPPALTKTSICAFEMLSLDMGLLVNIWLGTESEVVRIKIAAALPGSSDEQLLTKTQNCWKIQ